MRVRLSLRVAGLLLPIVLVGVACTDDATSGAPTPPDGGQITLDSGPRDAAGDTSAPDSAPPADAGTDSADAADAADAAATTIAPFNTGVDALGAALADDSVDPHWTIKDANGTTLTPYVKTDALGYPGYWLAPSATSKFISPFADTVDPSGSGTFTYKTTFSLRTGVDLAGVQLAIKYASDNSMSDIRLNGQSIGTITAGSYTPFQTVTVTTGFVVGTNTLELVSANSGGPTGARAELTLTAN